VDVGAAAFLRQTLIDLSRSGVAILVISEELEELFEICDRIAVLAEGRLSEAVPKQQTNAEKIGMQMSGLFSRQRHRPGARPCRCLKPARHRRPACACWRPHRHRPDPGRRLPALPVPGQEPRRGLRRVLHPALSSGNGWSELMVKAGPLILIAQGLAIGFRARIYNIGAEGQLIMGALAGGGVAIAFDGVDAWWVLPLMVSPAPSAAPCGAPSRPCCAPASTPRRPSPP
jgi:hypothetical protein